MYHNGPVNVYKILNIICLPMSAVLVVVFSTSHGNLLGKLCLCLQ